MAALHRLPSNVLRNLESLPAGKHADGGGLWLLRRKDGGGQWSFRYTRRGKAREMGLGSAQTLSLANARTEAARWREVLAAGDDPQKVRRDERAEQERREAEERPTFRSVAEAAYEARKASLKGDGKSARWMSPINVHILPKIGDIPIEDVNQRDIKAALSPIWNAKPDAAAKALYRIRIVLRHGAAMGCEVDLQAADKAKALLGAQRHKQKNVPALPWQEVPAFYESLNGETMAERALRLLILTACRSVEVRFCHLNEIEGDMWTVPSERMKGGVAHRVPLSAEARRVIEDAAQFAKDGFLFPGIRNGVISDMTMNALMRRRGMTERPHGFRASFRTWAAEATDTPSEVAEACLAHVSGTQVERAYRRSDFLERRRALMARWADHVTGGAGEVVKLEMV